MMISGIVNCALWLAIVATVVYGIYLGCENDTSAGREK